MSYKIIPTETFKTQVRTLQKKYPHIRQDLKDLSKRLSDVLSDGQKRNKIRNLLYAMAKRDGTIRSVGVGRRWRWKLVLDAKDDV